MPTALITGGAKRIGRAIALGLASKGYDVAIHYHSSKKEAEEIQKQISDIGTRAQLFPADLSRQLEVEALIPRVLHHFGRCDLLINNASTFENMSFLESNETHFDADLAVNYKAPFFLTQFFAKEVEKGSVINFLDTRVVGNSTDHFVYNLSKKSLRDLTRMSAKALAPRIRVNAICPGPIFPPPGKDLSSMSDLIASIPLQKPIPVEDIVAGVLFLVDLSSMTGECLFIDGGKHLLS